MEDNSNFKDTIDNIMDDMMKIALQVTETHDEFIFETVSNWLQDTQQIKVSKKELMEAIIFYRKAKATPMEHVHVNCELSKTRHDKLVEIGELDACVLSQFYSELAPYIKKNMESRHNDILDATIYSLDLYMKCKEEQANDRAD